MTPAPQTEPPPAATPFRPGPRPLALHLAIALGTWLSSIAALPSARAGSTPWHPSLAATAAALAAELESESPDALLTALGAEVEARIAEMLAGIEAYWRHPYRRTLPDPPVLWRQGATRVLDYGATAAEGREGPPVLEVPSLINRGYVLDLSERRSLLRYLARRGLRPLLVDWGAPGPEERTFDLSDYIAGRLASALEAAAAAGGPVALVGYCMGGNLALALAQLRGADLGALALLATPWDFHAERAAQARLFGVAADAIEGLLGAFGELPVDVLQAFFAALDPNLAGRKFRAFARMAQMSDEAEAFVALRTGSTTASPWRRRWRGSACSAGTAKTPRPEGSGASPARPSIRPGSSCRRWSRFPRATASSRPSRPGRWPGRSLERRCSSPRPATSAWWWAGAPRRACGGPWATGLWPKRPDCAVRKIALPAAHPGAL